MNGGSTFLKNYSSLASRNALVPNTGSFSTFLDFDTETGTAWQAWVFNSSTNGGGVAHVKFGLQGGYGSNGEINITIGPDGGDLITGTGPCSVAVNVRGGNPANISVWFTPEQTVRALPPLSNFNNNLTARTDFGFPPFGRNQCNILSVANFTVELEDPVGNTIATAVFAANSFLGDTQAFYHPNGLKLFLTPSAAPQRFKITHFE
jgi:hypothetical protein